MKRTPFKRKTPLRAKARALVRSKGFAGKCLAAMADNTKGKGIRIVMSPKQRERLRKVQADFKRDLGKAVAGMVSGAITMTREPMRKSRPKTTKARQAARDQRCLFNVAEVCNYDPSTVVLCHLPWLVGTMVGKKAPDEVAAHGCSKCHDWIDGRGVPRRAFTLQRECDRNFYAARALARMRIIDRDKRGQGNAS